MIERSLLEAFLIPFEIFLILVLIGVGVHNADKNPLENITKAYTERACVKGGFSLDDIKNLKSDLAKEGFDISSIEIKISPEAATPEKFNGTTVYAKRSEIINLNLTYNKLGLIDKVYKTLGSNTDIKSNASSYGMSEVK